MTRLARIASLIVAFVPGASLAAGLPLGPTDAWFEDRLVTVEAVESVTEPTDASNSHVVYTSAVQLPGGTDEPLIPVLESLPGAVDETAVWAEVDVVFVPGIMPRQLTSSADVLSAMAAGDVVLAPTGVLYSMTLISTGTSDTPGNRAVRGDLLRPIAVPDTDLNVTWGYVKGGIRH